MSSPVLRTKRSRRLLFGGHHSPIQGPCGLTVALRRTGLTNLLYEVALPQQTYPACGLSTPVPQGNWSLPHEKHSNSYHLLSFSNPSPRRQNIGRKRAGKTFFQSL